MDNALEQLQTNFSVNLLDNIVKAAYDPTNPHRAAANKALMQFQELPDVWTKADAILETSTNAETKFFGLQILDAAIRTRYVVFSVVFSVYCMSFSLSILHFSFHTNSAGRFCLKNSAMESRIMSWGKSLA